MGHQAKASVDRIFIGLLPGTALLAFLLFFHEIFDLTFDDFKMIVVGGILFIAYWQIMAKVFWAPYMRLFEEREGLTTGAEASAGETVAKAKDLEEQFEQGIKNARIEAMQQKLEKIAAASKEASDVVSKAEDRAKDEIIAARKQVQESLTPLRDRLFENAEEMVEETVAALKQPATASSSKSVQ